MLNIKSLLNKIDHIGTTSEQQNWEKRAIAVLNRQLIAAMLIHVPFIILFYVINYHWVTVLLLSDLLILFLSLYLSTRSLNYHALTLNIFWHVISIFGIGFLIKGDVGTQYALISMIISPLIIFGLKNKTVGVVSYLFVAFSSLIFIVMDISHLGLYQASDNICNLIQLGALLTLFVFVYLQVHFFCSRNGNSSKRFYH